MKALLQRLKRGRNPHNETRRHLEKLAKRWNFSIGAYSYGRPKVRFPESGRRLTIGRYCSIADKVEILLGRIAAPDWRRILKLADKLAPREAEALFATALDTAARFVSAELDRRQTESPARLAALVEAAERVNRAAREAAIYNLDRRPLVLTLFEELSQALRTP